MTIKYFDRSTNSFAHEKIYGGFFLRFMYQHWMGKALLPLIARGAWFSKLYGFVQKRGLTKKKVAPFIEKFGIDASEFEKRDFCSFNDFFTRRLKSDARPIEADSNVLTIPADGRYLVIEDLSQTDGIWVKGKTFDLTELLGDEELATRYRDGAVVIARLCPVDYHRFHFPCACQPGPPKLINGPLYSVSPLALKKNIAIFHENKRVITELDSDVFGKIQCVEVGATNVGSIVQTHEANLPVEKGAEKGYFEFGGSCLMLFIEKGRVQFEKDLIKYSKQKIEVRALMGQPLARKL